MAVKIKICGIKDYEDASLCVEQGVNALGFIFYRRSPRYILPRQAQAITKRLPCFISRVGVFVDEPESSVRQIAAAAGLDTLQFHGKETSAYCNTFRKDFKVIKSFFPKDASVLARIARYKVDGVLLDIPFAEKKKTPKAILDFRTVKKISAKTPFLILSGGLSEINVGELIKRLSPYAVDVARGVEKFPGKKDRQLVKNFIRAVNKAKHYA
ncbi:N-(5'-phosphoribosyl)anthranilate isomerase [Candidatus Omnitrophota bacterium]